MSSRRWDRAEKMKRAKRVRKGGCAKKTFKDLDRATNAGVSLASANRKPISVYLCCKCGSYHLTSMIGGPREVRRIEIEGQDS